jgi:hypothetical protein
MKWWPGQSSTTARLSNLRQRQQEIDARIDALVFGYGLITNTPLSAVCEESQHIIPPPGPVCFCGRVAIGMDGDRLAVYTNRPPANEFGGT